MSRTEPIKEWWTAEELAASGLPDLPTTKRRINAMADREDWRANPRLSRKRMGRGGGYEYHWKLLPSRAQAKLLAEVAPQPEGPAADMVGREEAWRWFDAQSAATKAKARDRLETIATIEALEAALGKFLAVEQVAKREDVSSRTIWRWFTMIEGVDVADRMPYLAPRRFAATENDPGNADYSHFIDRLKADYLRIGPHSFASSHRRAVKVCEANGWAVMTYRTAVRWLEKFPRILQVLAREGSAGLAKAFPPQIRDKSTLTALEGVNADCHKIDLFVQWPGIDKPVRPQIVAFQDIYSGKILSWRVDLDPNKVAVMSAFGDMIEEWGIPKHCLFDNGHEFATKWFSGGDKNRRRFKITDDEPLGVLALLGIQIHWATVAHGQAKPIERGFRDFANDIALDPRFAGAYVGKNPMAKPEDYGSRAIPRDVFLAVLEEGILDHNARQGRLSPTAKGRSFDDTFAESYAVSPIRKATPEQYRLWLMGQEVRRLHRTHGALTLFRNGYWADWMNEYAGKEIVARFDPENLHSSVFIYTKAGEYLGQADCREKVGFFDLVGARLHAKQDRQRKKAEKQLLDAMRPMSVQQFGAELDGLAKAETPLVSAKVVQLMPEQVRAKMMERPVPAPRVSEADEERQSAFVVEFQRAAEAPPEPARETPKDRFLRALAIEERSENGQPIGSAEADWLNNYQQTPEYVRQRLMWDDWRDESVLG